MSPQDGILNTGGPPQGMPAETVPLGGTSAAPGAEGQLPPEMQQKFDIYVANGIKVIHSPEVSDQLIERLKSSQNPIVDIADSTIAIVERLDSSGADKGGNVPLEIKAHAANIFMGEIMTIAESVGMPPLDEEQRYQCYSLAVSKYLDKSVKSGKISPEELQQMGQQAAQSPKGQEIMQGIQNAQQGGAQPMDATSQGPAMPGTSGGV